MWFIWLLVISLIVLVVLFLAARYWRVANGLRATIRVLASIPVFGADIADKIQNVCKAGIDKTLHWREFSTTPAEEKDDWRVSDLIHRLFLLLLSVCVIGGDLPFAIFRNKALAQIEQITHIPLPTDILGGLLWVVVPAFCGEALLDVAKHGLKGTSLLPRPNQQWVRWLLVSFTLLVFAVAVFNTFLFFYSGQYLIAYGDSPTIDQLSLWIYAIFGVLVAIVAFPAGRALYLGLGGIVCLLLGLGYVVVFLLSLPFRLSAKFIQGIETIVTAVNPVEVVPQQMSVSPVVPSLITDGEQDRLPTYIEGAKGIDGEKPMEISKRTTSLGSCGTQGTTLLQQVAEDVQYLSASNHIVGYTLLDPESQKHIHALPIAGALNLTPSSQEIRRAQDGSHSTGETIERLFLPTITRLKQAYANRLAGTFVLSADFLLLQHILPGLRELKDHLPLLKVLLITALPTIGADTHQLQTAYDQLVQLKQQNVVDAILLFDESSPAVKIHSRKEQQRYIARNLVSLIVAHDHASEQNPPFEHLVEAIGRMGPVCSFAYATAPIVEGEPVWWWKILRGFKRNLPPRGQGAIGDVMNQAEAMFRHMLRDPSTHAVDAPIDPSKPLLYVVNIPLSPREKRFDEVARHIYRQVQTMGPAYPIVVGASGIPDPKFGEAAYFSSAFCIYPLTKVELLQEPASEEVSSRV